MMALRLDAICAKLKLNISGSEVTISSSENNNETKSHNSNCSQGFLPSDNDGPQGRVSDISTSTVKPEDNQLDDSTSKKEYYEQKSTPRRLEKSSENPGSVMGVGDAISTTSSRRNRRKNFQPRFVQEVQEEDNEQKLAEMTLPKEDASNIDVKADEVDNSAAQSEVNSWVGSEQDNGVLDLRVVDVTRELCPPEWTVQGKSANGATEEITVDSCGVIDLSMPSKVDSRSNLQSDLPQSDITTHHGRPKVEPCIASNEHAPPLNIPLNDVGHSTGEGVAINDFALQTMNRLLKIYGLSEDADPDSQGKRPSIPIPIPTMQSKALLWQPNVLAKLSGIPTSATIPGVPSIIPDDLKRPFSAEDLDLTKSSASPSSQSMDASASSFIDDETSTPAFEKNSKQSAFIPEVGGFSSRVSLSKRSSFKQFLPDYSKYAKRFNSYEECSGATCRERGYKEHFHCTVCASRVCLKKEEMIRHFKWHKKREDSLQHGFMRYSPLDDCSKRFSTHCSHNGKHTHYHCLQSGCSKVYISTSDVQMHANYHRKDSAIIQEGFQRFRATENCAMASCSFTGQKTTHFHCRRPGCNFTFKNKADMEKHKTYHQKDEILTRDGFKKFMKYEQCHYAGCHYSRVSNHIHCIRPGCSYVLHSTGQLYSHKRKHERRELEQAMYKQLGASSTADLSNVTASEGLSLGLALINQPSTLTTAVKQETNADVPLKAKLSKIQLDDHLSQDSGSLCLPLKSETKDLLKTEFEHDEDDDDDEEECFLSSGMVKIASDLGGKDLGDSLNLPIPLAPLPDADGRDDGNTGTECGESTSTGLKSKRAPFFLPKALPPVNEKKERDESWKKYLTRYTANDPCHARCQYLYKDHYHCIQAECGWLFRSKDGVREHAKFHEQQDRITALTFMKYDADTKCNENCEYNEKLLHYHCLWTNCNHVVSSKDSIFSRLEHHKFHESAGRKAGLGGSSNLENLKRKRGRPPKFPKNDIPIIPKVEMTEEEINAQARLTGLSSPIANGFQKYETGQVCPDETCVYAQTEHYHCVRPRCHHVTNRKDVLGLHAKDFHNFISIADGFEFFDRNVNCRRPHCHNNQSNRHFHCIRPKCDYSFVRYTTMLQHERKHRAVESASTVDSVLQAAIKSKAYLAGNSSAMSKLVSSAQGSAGGARSTTALFPVSTLVSADGPVLLSSASVGLAPMLLTAFQPLAGLSSQTVTPIVVAPITHEAHSSAHDLQLASSSLKLVSIAPKPPTVVALQAPISGSNGFEIAASGVAQSGASAAAPLTMLLQQKTAAIPSLDWVTMKLKMHHEIHQNCGRPFCKLKKKDHYHCFDCNQAFSDPVRLKSHIARHGFTLDNKRTATQDLHGNGGVDMIRKSEEGGGNANGTETASSMEEEESDEEKEQETQTHSDFSMDQSAVQLTTAEVSTDGNEMDDFDDSETDRLVIDLSSIRSNNGEGVASVLNDSASVSSGNSLNYLPAADGNSETKKVGRKRGSSEINPGNLKAKKLQAAPGGFEKFRFSEDCGQERCAYRLSMTHYHCSRPDCGYSFCDHSRFLQHSDRHRRIDVIMGDQFQHFHAKMDCRYEGCEHARTATHFHCLSCSFICTDSSKVVAHRKHHSKMERIAENGFKKFGVGEDCDFAMCIHRMKQTHYHCASPGCGHVVMGPAQMGSHKAKHLNSGKFSSASSSNFSEGFE